MDNIVLGAALGIVFVALFIAYALLLTWLTKE